VTPTLCKVLCQENVCDMCNKLVEGTLLNTALSSESNVPNLLTKKITLMLCTLNNLHCFTM